MSVETRREHSRVVEYQAIAGLQEQRKITKDTVLKRSGGAIHHKHA